MIHLWVCDLLYYCLALVFVCVCVCVCNLSISPTEWVCFLERWPVFSPLSSSHLSLCCSCHFISQLPIGPLTKEYGKAVVFIHSLSSLLPQMYWFFSVCVCVYVSVCWYVCASYFLRVRTRVHSNCSVFVSACRKPEDLSREVIQIQQREIALKEKNYTLNSR